MNTLQVNGVAARTSTLTQRAYRAAPCELLVTVTPDNKNKALAAFVKGDDFSGLHVSGIADLSFLADFPNLRYLEVVNQKKVNTRPLDELENLRGLRIETPGAGLDFSCFPELEFFVGDWHPDNTNVCRAGELRQLWIWQFKPKSLDLSELAHATRLEWLHLTQTNIASLGGLETLEDLRYCEIAYAPQLQSLDALGAADVGIRELSLSKAKKIASYEPIASLKWLRRLKLSDCAPMPDLQWTRSLERLDMFTFVETLVEDGDLSPLLALPRLRYVGTMDKKHYSHKSAAINALLEKRAEANR